MKFFTFLLFWLVSINLNSLVYCESNAKSVKQSYVFVKNVRPSGNVIISDVMLKKSLEMGPGIYLATELLDLIAEEVEGFYSSNGFHRIRAYISQLKSNKGTITLDIYEEPEIKAGKTDILRAEIAINQLIARNNLRVGHKTKKNARKVLVERYKLKRIAKAEANQIKLRYEGARAKTQRKRYLKILLQKKKSERESLLTQRENLINILTHQEQFFVKIKKDQIERLEGMRDHLKNVDNNNPK